MSIIRFLSTFLLITFYLCSCIGQDACATLNLNDLSLTLIGNGVEFEKFLPNTKGREEVCNIILKNESPSIQLSIKQNDKFEDFANLFPQYITKLIKDGELISKLKPEGDRRVYEKINQTQLNACFHFSDDFVKLVWITKGDNLYSLKFNNTAFSKEKAQKLLLDIAVLVK